MSRPAFSAPLIAELNRRVIAHNGLHPHGKTRLQDLKKLYQRHYQGQNPAERALRKVDHHLEELAKAFDPDKHPRRSDGRFGPKDDAGASNANGAEESAADKAKRLVGGIADAAAAGGAGVKRGLHHAAYQAGLADEPLAEGVAAPDKVPLDLPGDRDQHRALQAENAGYSAVTSDVLPERRGEIVGSLVRTGLAGAGGALVAHMLVSKNPRNFVRRGLARGAAIPAGLAAKIAVGIPLHSAAAVLKLAEDITGVKLKSIKVKDFAHDTADKAGKAVGSKAYLGAYHTIGPLRWSTARFLDAMEGRSRTPPNLSEAIKPGEKLTRENSFKIAKLAMQVVKTEGRAKAGRAAGIVAIAAVPAYLINRAIAGSPLDPQTIGASYDQVSYRVIQKALALPETDELTKAISGELRKASPLEGFEDALAGKLWTKVGTAGASALASAAGSAIGAASGASVQAIHNALNKPKGDPYRDAEGRFTSKEDAVNGSGIGQAALAGAAAGAVLARSGAHLRLASLNRGMFRMAMNHLDAHIANQTTAINTSGKYSTIPAIKDVWSEMQGKLADFVQKKDQFIKDHIAADEGVKIAKAEVATYGAHSPLYYKDRARRDVNAKLVSMLAPNDHFRLPDPKTGEMVPMTAIRRSRAEPNQYANQAIDGMDLDQFKLAIAKLLPKEQTAALHFYELRQKLPGQIDEAMTAHKSAIAAAHEAVTAARTARTALDEERRNAKADLDIHAEPGPSREGAEKTFAAVEKKIGAADKKLTGAQHKLNELQTGGPEVISPFDGRPIEPPTVMDKQMVVQTKERGAMPRAEAAFKKQQDKLAKDLEKAVGKARDKALADLKFNHARQIATYVGLGKKSAGLNHIMGRDADTLFAAHVDHDLAATAADKAERQVAAHRATLADLKDKRAAAPKAERTKLDPEIAKAAAELKAAEAAQGDADAIATAKRADFAQAADTFLSKYEMMKKAAAQAKSGAFMPPAVLRDLGAGISRAAKEGYDPVSRYAVEPTLKNLHAVMHQLGPQARALGAGTVERGKKMFGREYKRQNGTTGWYPDPVKIAWAAAPAAAAFEFGRQSVAYGQARWNGDNKAKAPTNLQVELQRHPTRDEGLFAVHAAHPKNKNERIVLFGHRYVEGKAEPIDINPGARLSDVLNQQSQQSSGNRGDRPNVAAKDAGWLSEKARSEIGAALAKIAKEKRITISGPGVSVPARDPSENDGNAAAGTFLNEFKTRWVKPDTSGNAGAMYGALDALFQKQSEILKPGQFYTALTGYKGTEKKGDGVLKSNEDFKSDDKGEVAGALDAEITRIMAKSAPRDEGQKDALRRAVAVIGRARGLSDDTLKPIYDKIDGAAPRETTYSEKAVSPEIPIRHATDSVQMESPPWRDDSLANEAPRNLTPDAFDQADAAVREIGPKLGIGTPRSEEMLGSAIALYAGAVSEAKGVDITTAVNIVKEAMLTMGSGDRSDRESFKLALQNFDTPEFEKAISRVIRRNGRKNDEAQKADFILGARDLDDIETLMKRMPPAFSEFTNQAQSNPLPDPPVYKPVQDSLAAAADLAGAGLANHILSHQLPKVAPWAKTPEFGAKETFHAIAHPIQAIKTAASGVTNAVTGGSPLKAIATGARTVGVLGAKGLLAGGLGAALYSGVQAATGGNEYRRNTSSSENLTMGVGNFAGATAGEMAGKAIAERAVGAEAGEALGGIAGSALGPVGTVAGEIGGGAIGGALGELIGHAAFQKYFSGYDPKAVARIAQTQIKPPSPIQAGRAEAGEVIGGTIGNIAGAAGEGLGGTLGAAAGIASAAETKVRNALPGRPKQQSGQVP